MGLSGLRRAGNGGPARWDQRHLPEAARRGILPGMKLWALLSLALVCAAVAPRALQAAEFRLPEVPGAVSVAPVDGAPSAAVLPEPQALPSAALSAAAALAREAAPAAAAAALPELRRDASAGADAASGSFDGARPPQPGSLEAPLAGPLEPRVSARRSRMHVDKKWRGTRALTVPLAGSDHTVLMGAALGSMTGVTSVSGGLFSSLLVSTGQATVVGGVVVALVFASIGAGWLGPILASGHFKESRDAAAVTRNARRYAQGAPRRWDARILSYARRFEAETGWKIAWTDSEHVLAKADPAGKRVLLSIDWALESAEKRDRRRIAYFWDTVNLRLGEAAKRAGR